MPSLSRLKSAFTPTTPTAKAAADLDTARAELAAAEEAHATLVARRGDIALDGTEQEKVAFRAELAAAEERVAAAVTRVARAEKALADAEKSEEQAEAKRFRVDAEKKIRKVADRSAVKAAYDTILNDLADTAAAELAVATSNARPVDGLDPLPPVELTIRGLPGRERRIVSERNVRVWCYASTGQRIPEDAVPDVIKRGNTGVLPPTPWSPMNTPVELRQFREVTFVPEQRGEWPLPLAATLRLPALIAGDAEGWTPMSAHAEPQHVLEQVEAMRAAAGRRPSEPQPIVELIPLEAEPGDNPQKAANAA